MDVVEISTKLFQDYGPISLGWIAAVFVWMRFVAEAKLHRDDLHLLIADYKSALDSIRGSINENTKVTERLVTLLDERTRGRS